uniref:FMRFamide-like peptide Sa12b n=2 Tax=Sphecina TaxID=421036 RepID=FLP12_SPHAA|nr:RecName: Full=FMRFamide-like peptide Sa12b; Short=Sa-12; Short=Sa12b; AltName: Full=Sa-112; Short=Sa112 [Sphex argentatus argentatus]P0DUV2.1 RecName: Full=FMRFamide-like peptide Sh5a; AltName: Full=FMRFamide-like peptide Sa-112; Short=Sa112; Contains: RecName: Full=FMRFamide-like peptide Sh5b [Isodontia harmandi]
EDVDHVFLRF